MPNPLNANRLPDDNEWPFLGRRRQMEESIAFLLPGLGKAPSRLLRVAGESGVGKSFFAKELVCRFTKQAPSSIALYIDVDECEFESAELTKRLTVLAYHPSLPTRKDPQNVPEDASLAQYLRPHPRWLRVLRHAYRVLRELSASIPFVGKVIKALLPAELPVARERELATSGRFWDYAMEAARKRPVLLVVDNFQFLPESVVLELDTVVPAAETGFRLLIVDRLQSGVSRAGHLRCFSSHRLTVELSPLTRSDIYRLVRLIVQDVENLDGLCEALYRKSQGNPKQLWLQLRTLHLKHRADEERASLTDYEETILNLPPLDRLALQLVTLLMGGLKLDDVVRILQWIVHPFTAQEIRNAILDLAVIGLLLVNGAVGDRVRIEHELVRVSVRQTTSEQDAHDLRQQVISALSGRLDHAIDDNEYERIVDRLVGLLTAKDLEARHDLLAHFIALIDRQRTKENFHYLCSLYASPACHGTLHLLPAHCVFAFLDAFQKTSQFDKGLAAVQMITSATTVSRRHLSLFAAKYLVQKFEYREAERILADVKPGSDRDMILFNILLNLCREDEAREIVASVPTNDRDLDECHSVILRNAAHLYDPPTARELLNRAYKCFRRNGLKFGEATALNNLGALELWAKRKVDARSYLTSARGQLEALGSNEAYQPLTNLAILSALEGDLCAARQLLDQARASLSPWLRMDEIMILFNGLVLDMMDSRVSVENAAVQAKELYRRSLQTKDIRFQDVLAWFSRQLDLKVTGSSSIPELEEFYDRFLSRRRCGIEVFFNANCGGTAMTLVYQLSAHWRY